MGRWKKSDRRELIELAQRNARMIRLQKSVCEKRDQILAESYNGPLCNYFTGIFESKERMESMDRNPGPGQKNSLGQHIRKRRPAGLHKTPGSPEKRFRSSSAFVTEDPEGDQDCVIDLETKIDVHEMESGHDHSCTSTDGNQVLVESNNNHSAEKEKFENVNMVGHFKSYSQHTLLTVFDYAASSFALRALADDGIQGKELRMLPAAVLNELVGGIPKQKTYPESEGPIQSRMNRFGIPKANRKQIFCPATDGERKIMGPVEICRSQEEIDEMKITLFRPWEWKGAKELRISDAIDAMAKDLYGTSAHEVVCHMALFEDHILMGENYSVTEDEEIRDEPTDDGEDQDSS